EEVGHRREESCRELGRHLEVEKALRAHDHRVLSEHGRSLVGPRQCRTKGAAGGDCSRNQFHEIAAGDHARTPSNFALYATLDLPGSDIKRLEAPNMKFLAPAPGRSRLRCGECLCGKPAGAPYPPLAP